MRHPEERLTAFVDGELGHGDRDRVLAHLVDCSPCRAEADVQRMLKRQLHALGDRGPTSEFVGRLHALADSARPWPPVSGSVPSAPSAAAGRTSAGPAIYEIPADGIAPAGGIGPRTRPAVGGGRDRGRRPSDNRPGGTQPVGRRRPRSRYVAAGAASLAALGIATTFASGADPARLPRLAPAIERFAVEHALTSEGIPFIDPAPAVSPGTRP